MQKAIIFHTPSLCLCTVAFYFTFIHSLESCASIRCSLRFFFSRAFITVKKHFWSFLFQYPHAVVYLQAFGSSSSTHTSTDFSFIYNLFPCASQYIPQARRPLRLVNTTKIRAKHVLALPHAVVGRLSPITGTAICDFTQMAVRCHSRLSLVCLDLGALPNRSCASDIHCNPAPVDGTHLPSTVTKS